MKATVWTATSGILALAWAGALATPADATLPCGDPSTVCATANAWVTTSDLDLEACEEQDPHHHTDELVDLLENEANKALRTLEYSAEPSLGSDLGDPGRALALKFEFTPVLNIPDVALLGTGDVCYDYHESGGGGSSLHLPGHASVAGHLVRDCDWDGIERSCDVPEAVVTMLGKPGADCFTVETGATNGVAVKTASDSADCP